MAALPISLSQRVSVAHDARRLHGHASKKAAKNEGAI
jgi:hypothetical protein